MRILLVSIYAVSRSGGLTSHVNELSAGLRRAGHEVHAMDPHSAVGALERRFIVDLPRLFGRSIDRDGAYLHFLRSSRRLLARAIARSLRARPVDVVHAHDPAAFLAAADAVSRTSSGTRPRLVLTVHGDIANMAVSDDAIASDGRGRRETERLEAEAYRSADALIAVDQRLARHCAALSGRASIEVFANFVDADLFRPPSARDVESLGRLRAALGLGERERVLLATRRLVKKNGVLHAVRAMADRRLSMGTERSAVLLVVGKGPERATLEREADRLGLGAGGTRTVRFLGDVPHDELPDYYRLADAVVIPSVPDANVIEATSISALEAMASGRVVIASGIGGLAELVDDRRTGLLVPPGDPQALAAAAEGVLSDPARAEEIGRTARAFVEEQRSSPACIPRVLGIYRGERCGSST